MRRSSVLFSFCCALGLASSVTLASDPAGAAAGGNNLAREVEDILARGPATPNPVLSFLPAGVAGDWQYWNARMALDAQLRRRTSSTRRALEVVEVEAAGATGENDLPILGQPIPGVGTAAGDQSSVRIRGALLAPPTDLPAAVEPDTSIPEAQELSLVAGAVVAIPGIIGDGNAPRADFDFFRLLVSAGQRLQLAVRTPDPTAALDPIVGLYNSAGTLVAANDNRPVNGVLQDRDSLLEVALEVPGTYFVAVGGFNPIGGGDLPPQFPSNPFDSATAPPRGSEGEYRLLVGLDAPPATDRDFYRFQLRAGDVVGAVVDGGGAGVSIAPVRFDGDGSPLAAALGSNLSAVLPVTSPLPMGGRAAAFVVVTADGEYAVGAESAPDFDVGAYVLDVTVARSPLGASPSPRRQILFLDLDGASVDPALFGFPSGTAVLSPFASFLDRWGLQPEEEEAAIDAIVAVVQENLESDIRARGLEQTFQVEIRNSRDDGDPFGEPDVSRIVLGGSIAELGIGTIGIAESVDVGNFSTAETGIVLLDSLSAEAPDPNSLNSLERAPGVSMTTLIGAAVGSIAAHEAGHLFANFHTDRGPGPANIMDRGGNLPRFLGVGEDGIFGSGDDLDPDFGKDQYEPAEGLTGIEDTLNSIAFDLGSGGLRPALTVVPVAARSLPGPGEVSLGAVAIGDTVRQDFMLGNGGTAELTVSEIALRGVTGAGFSLADPFMPFPLPPGSARTVTVLFSPAALGPATARLEISTDSLAEEQAFLLSAQGGVPTVAATPLAHDFGVVEYSEADPTRSFVFDIRNEAATGDLEIQRPLAVGQAPSQYDLLEAFPDSLPGGTASVSIPPGGSLALPITFRPTGLVRGLSATAVLRTNDPSTPLIFLQLDGVANGPDVDILPRFGLFFSALRPGTGQTRTVTLNNLGTRELDISTLTLSGPNTEAFIFTPPPLPLLLPPGGEQELNIRFEPSSLGLKSAVLEIVTNDPDEAMSAIPLEGVGAEPNVVVEEGAGDFGPVRLETGRTQTLEIVNAGGFRLRVSETVITGPQADEFRILSGAGPFTVSPDIAWPVGIRFQPAEEGLRQAVLAITSDDPDQPLLEVPLTGRGALPAIGLTKECEVLAAAQVVVCFLDVTSLGPGTAPGVQVEDDLPPGLLYLEDSCGAGEPAPGEPWIWIPGSLPEGESAVCDLTLTIGPEASPTTVNTATATTSLQAAGDPAAIASAVIELPALAGPVEIPTASSLGLGILAFLLALQALVRLRRKPAPLASRGQRSRHRDN